MSSKAKNTNAPKYQKLADMLRGQIETGRLKSGQKLPPVREMAYQMGVTAGTIARSYRSLIDEGYLEAGVGQGTYVKQLRASTLPHDDQPLHLSSPRLPDMGQIDIIQRGFRSFTEHIGFNELMAYPIGIDTYALQEANLMWLQKIPLGPVEPEDVVATGGGHNACLAILQHFLMHKKKVTVAVGHLSYPGFRDLSKLVNADVHAIECDADGPCPEHFEKVVREHGINVFLTSAEVNSPTTQFTTTERRKALVAVAREYDVAIVEDDCFGSAQYFGVSYRALYPENGWYVASFSKSIAPSLRIGCAICPKGQADALRHIIFSASLGISSAQVYVANFVLRHSKLAETQKMVRDELRVYVAETVKLLDQFDISWKPDVPMIWLTLPRGWRTTAFCSAAEKLGVLVSPGEIFVTRESRAPHAVRICVNCEYGLERYLDGISTLAELLRNPDRSSGI